MRIAVILLLACTLSNAQSSSTLSAKYGHPTSETYRVRPDIVVTVSYAKSGDVCAMQIQSASRGENGKPTLLKSQPLNEVIDELVPKETRGRFLMGTFANINCLPDGGCDGTNESYERLSIFRGGNIDAYRFADITWKLEVCKAEETNKTAR